MNPERATETSAIAADIGSTRDRILAALVEVILEGGLPGFSVQEVADRAGVSHRTVYRHFPTRESLLESLAGAVDRRMVEWGGFDHLEDLGELSQAVRTNFALFSRDARTLEAAVRFGVGAAIETLDRRERSEAFRDLVADAVPALAPEDAAMAAAVLRQIASSRTWLGLREIGLDEDATARAAAWAVAVLGDALRAGRTPAGEAMPGPRTVGPRAEAPRAVGPRDVEESES